MIFNKKIPAASRRGILDAFEKSLAKPNSIFAPRGGVLDPKLHNEIWVSSEQESPKNRASGLVAGHQSLICGELHHPSGLQGKRFVRFRIGFIVKATGSRTHLGLAYKHPIY